MSSRVTKTYPAVTGPGTTTANAPVVPANDLRKGLIIQNTGANPGQYRFAGQVQGPTDPTLAAGLWIKWDQADTVPLDSVSLSSVAATSWAIQETV